MMAVTNERLSKLRKVSYVWGCLLLASALLSAPEVLTHDKYDLFYTISLVTQLVVSVIFLLAAYLIGDENRSSYRLYQWACRAGVIYALLFTVSFLDRSIDFLGISFVTLFSCLILLMILGGPFIWCLKQARKRSRAF